MRKTYVLDTSTIVSDPYCLDSFPDANIIIHTKVLSELDKLKTSYGDVGRNARVFIRILDELSERGSVSAGLDVGNRSILRIDSGDYGIEFGTAEYTDNNILGCAKSMINGKNNPVAIVSQDINLRLRAKSANISAINHGGNKSTIDEIYSGIRTIVDERSGAMLKEEYQIDCYENEKLESLLPNECVIFENAEGKTIAYGRRRGDKIKFVNGTRAWGLGARNVEQAMALDLLMDPSVHLVSLAGIAGTGKTILGMAAGIESVVSLKIYDKMEIYRPFQPVGKDVGYLPGDLNEKLDPWMGAIRDSIDVLVPSNRSSDTHRRKNVSTGPAWRNNMAQFSDQIHMEALTYLRGRSIANTFILIDECFPYNQYIKTENGKKKIGQLVKLFHQGVSIKVKTFNEENNKFELKSISNAWDRGEKELLELTMGNRKIKCTHDHKFLTINGWQPAREIPLGELILTSEPNEFQLLKSLNRDQYQLFVGSYLGDGSISNHGRSRFRLRIAHGMSQAEYCAWKSEMFESTTSIMDKNGFSQKPAIKFTTKIIGLNKDPFDKNNCPQWIIDDLDYKSIAIWYMDDGSYNGCNIRLSACSFNDDSCKRLCTKLKKLGINTKIRNYKGYNYIDILKKDSEKFFTKISQFVHQSMDYKLPAEYLSIPKYQWNNKFNNYGFTVLDNKNNLHNKQRVYDIEVEDNHNFILCSGSRHKQQGMGGPIAHNCQNITKEEIKTILTRAGENSKIVLTGDIEQIDDSRLDAINNGLTYTIDKFKSSELAGHISLRDGVRSPLAAEAARLL